MSKTILLIAIFSTLAVGNPDGIPYDLADEVYALVDELRSTVMGHISATYSDLSFIYRDIDDYGSNTYNQGFINIDMVHEQITAVIASIKELASSEGKDPSVCTAEHDETIEGLPTDAKVQLRNCVSGHISEAGFILNAAQYNIDIIINKVDAFDFQVLTCHGDLLCLSPVIERIELAMVQLPQEISVEVERTRELVKALEVIMDECATNHISAFSSTMATLLNQIAECVGDL